MPTFTATPQNLIGVIPRYPPASSRPCRHLSLASVIWYSPSGHYQSANIHGFLRSCISNRDYFRTIIWYWRSCVEGRWMLDTSLSALTVSWRKRTENLTYDGSASWTPSQWPFDPVFTSTDNIGGRGWYKCLHLHLGLSRSLFAKKQPPDLAYLPVLTNIAHLD